MSEALEENVVITIWDKEQSIYSLDSKIQNSTSELKSSLQETSSTISKITNDAVRLSEKLN